MATGRIGVTPVLRTRWSDQPTAGTTVLSGLDDNSVALVYDAGYEAVYRNGVLLSRGNDYTATDGTTITLIDATLAGDIIEVFANDLVPLTDAISKGQYNAKGALLSASAASTPAVLPVGTNGQVLTAASGESTGLQWATPASGGMTLINTGGTTLSGASTTISSIPSTYNNLEIFIRLARPATNSVDLRFRLNGDSGATSYGYVFSSGGGAQSFVQDFISITDGNLNSADTWGTVNLILPDYANTSTYKQTQSTAMTMDDTNTAQYRFASSFGIYKSSSAINSITFLPSSGNWTSGTVFIYGVK